MATVAAHPTKSTVKAEARVATLSRRRRILVWTLVVAASVIALVSTLTLWVDRQMLDNHAWKNATTHVIQDPKVQAALATYTVNQLYDNVNVAQALEQGLPPNLKHLSGSLATALRQPAERTAQFILMRPRFQQLFVNVSATAHQKLINVLENKTGYGISTGNGVVTLNLHDLVMQLGTELGLSQAALEKIPADAGVITLMKSDQLSAAQKGVRLVKILSVWLLVLVFGLYALAIYLARGVRRTTLRNVGWALAIVGVIVLVVRHFLGNWAVDTLSSPSYHGTVRDVWLIGTSILGQIGTTTILYGLVAVAAATLAGSTRAAVTLRRWLAPSLNEQPGLTAAVVAGLYLLVILWGPTHALRMWWGILVFAGLIALGVVALRRQTLREFPTAARAPAAVPAGAKRVAATPPASPAEEISRLAALHDSGAISDEEYVRAKELVLSA